MLVREKRLRLNLNTANFSSRNEEFYQRNQNQLQQQMCKRKKKWLNSTKPEERGSKEVKRYACIRGSGTERQEK